MICSVCNREFARGYKNAIGEVVCCSCARKMIDGKKKKAKEFAQELISDATEFFSQAFQDDETRSSRLDISEPDATCVDMKFEVVVNVNGVYTYEGESGVTFNIQGDGHILVGAGVVEMRACKIVCCDKCEHRTEPLVIGEDNCDLVIDHCVFVGCRGRSAICVRGNLEICNTEFTGFDVGPTMPVVESGTFARPTRLLLAGVRFEKCRSTGGLVWHYGESRVEVCFFELCECGGSLLCTAGLQMEKTKFRSCRTKKNLLSVRHASIRESTFVVCGGETVVSTSGNLELTGCAWRSCMTFGKAIIVSAGELILDAVDFVKCAVNGSVVYGASKPVLANVRLAETYHVDGALVSYGRGKSCPVSSMDTIEVTAITPETVDRCIEVRF